MTNRGFDRAYDATHELRFEVGAPSRAGLLKRAALFAGGAFAAGGVATALAQDASSVASAARGDVEHRAPTRKPHRPPRRVVDPRSPGDSRPTPGRLGPPLPDEPDLLPGRVSHGCIRMRNADILRLAKLMPVGTPLTIQ
jgi:hypothetical protein